MLDKKIYNSNDEITWCPGCGNFAILKALKQALAELELKPEEVLICSGIGQAAKTPHYINANGFNSLHGRAIPPAIGAKMANKDLKVLITSGDGDSYGEGGNHLLHNIRRNIDITHFVHDNQIYGLTKGQGSPTTEIGQKTTMQFDGVLVPRFNPAAFAISLGCTFVARAFCGDVDHLADIMKEAINHNGYALVDILQPCVTFNHVNTYKWYRERVYKLAAEYDAADKTAAFNKAMEWGDDGIPIGILYKENRASYIDSIPYLKDGEPLIKRKWSPMDAEKFMDDFK